MTRRYEAPDLRATNDRMARKRKRRAQFRVRTQPTRDRVRRLALLTMLSGTGVLRCCDPSHLRPDPRVDFSGTGASPSGT